ncbi:MAG: YggS family pyridoxal phosphate-dependent enzyme [Chloroflexi bacterium]|nr:YggS family pyridoxal phosphate-dependent enzyme [Chloroflexota bacterium]
MPDITQESVIRQNLQEVRDRITVAAARSGRRAEDVKLVGVSKTKPATDVVAAIEAGLEDFGENYVQEAAEKIPRVQQLAAQGLAAPRWHMIGHLQRNKAKQALQLFHMIHAVDSVRLAIELGRRALQLNRVATVLLEVNVSGEDTKSGFWVPGGLQGEDASRAFIVAAKEIASMPGVEARGLMTMAPFVDDPERVRPVFCALRELRDALQEQDRTHDWRELSMGMTGDFPVAIEEGATLVRVGRAIFGERNPNGGSNI